MTLESRENSVKVVKVVNVLKTDQGWLKASSRYSTVPFYLPTQAGQSMRAAFFRVA